MQWFALLGRETALSEAELAAQTQGELVFTHNVAFGLGATPAWNRLGGVMRGGKIVASALKRSTHLAAELVVALGEIDAETSKVSVGLSAPALPARELMRVGGKFKRAYAERYGRKLRLVYPKTDNLLNAGQLLNNRLVDTPNAELIILEGPDQQLAIGRTTWFQDIESYGLPDRGRPARDARVGMLPPKLAQILLNLAEITPQSHVHDPFCGTGVVLQEARLMDARVSGSDISDAMVRATQQNLAWLEATYHLPHHEALIRQQDARQLSLPPQTTHIVAEGYLGNPDFAQTELARMQCEALELKPLYLDFFRRLQRFDGPLMIVLALPEWHPSGKPVLQLDILDDLSDMGYTLRQFAPRGLDRLSYHRSHQSVGRSIIKLSKD